MATKREYAYLAYCLWKGDEVLDELLAALQKDGYCDEDGEWIYRREED